MYCPKCFNDTLKLSSSGVVKLTFNGKAKATSQFFYDLKNEKASDTYKKFKDVVEEYFDWYSGFANKEPLTDFKMYSSDFVCTNRCAIGGSVQLSVIDLVVPKEIVLDTLKMVADRYNIPVKLKGL